MPALDKIIDKMKRQPNGVTMSEADKVLVANGYRLARQKGSHCHYINTIGDVITIKKENPLKAVYVKDILRRIQRKGE
ncbi:MAG: type II toxin-antitoxin system HicA family toxin [Oscillospiraceae bacterium]|nr:type II toxin-antitoxin system HicA family toxin [Oscillospiraceae bacterium]